MTAQPHPMRCETCEYNYRSKEHKCPYDHADRYYSLKEEMRLPKGAWLFTSIVGCASHSSAGAQQRVGVAISLLKRMEWSGSHTDDENWGVLTIACPCCLNSKEQGHKTNCELNALLQQAGDQHDT